MVVMVMVSITCSLNLASPVCCLDYIDDFELFATHVVKPLGFDPASLTHGTPPRLLSQVSTTKSIVVAKLDPRLPQIHLHSWRGTWRGHQEFTPSSFDASQKLPTILVCQMSCLFLKETKGSSCGLNLSWIRCMCRLFQGTLPGVEGVCGFDLLLYYK